MNDEVEQRAFELRLDGEEDPKIVGYGAVFNSESQVIHPGFREVVAPGAFKKTLAEDNGRILSLFNHDNNFPLGRTGAGTLIVREDKRGLYYEVNPPASRSDVVESIKRGDVPGGSFQFVTVKDSWDGLDTDIPTRTLNEVRLMELGPVMSPAYLNTVVSARALEQVRAAAEARSQGKPLDGSTPTEPRTSEESEPREHSDPDTEPQEHSEDVRTQSIDTVIRRLRIEAEAARKAGIGVDVDRD